MLQSLYISNYALIDETKIEFGKGLNILTGETGAGKSLLLGAIGLILGKRLDFGIIFNPDRKCVVEAVFANIPPAISQTLRQMEDFDWEESQLVLRREASANGKSRAFVNDTPVSLQVLKDVTAMLVDLHGQNQNQALLAPEYQLQLLDQFAGSSTQAESFGLALQAVNAVRRKIQQAQKEEAEARKQQDYHKFLLEELQNAQLVADEEQQLEDELQTLENAEEIKESLGFAAASLYENESSAYSQLSEVIQQLEKLGRYNTSIAQQKSNLLEARIILQEAVRELEHLNDSIDLDPARLAEMQARYDFLNRLKKKYQVGNIADLIALREQYAEKVSRFDSLGDEIIALEKELAAQVKELGKLGLELEQKRKSVTPLLNKAVDDLLAKVGFAHAQFEVSLSRNLDKQGFLEIAGEKVLPLENGLNLVDFRIRTNAGMPMGSLGQIASGGEISRVMLAIKAALAEKAELSVLIFDEIDTGISGETAHKVGKVMRDLAQAHQLISITHLPQIAAKGHHHYHIFKEVLNGATISHVRPLDEEKRVLEIAHMLSGESLSESAISNAKELISSGRT